MYLDAKHNRSIVCVCACVSTKKRGYTYKKDNPSPPRAHGGPERAGHHGGDTGQEALLAQLGEEEFIC